MEHLRYCIDEMLAEVDARLASEPVMKALAQLDERDRRGETLDTIDSSQLRAYLQREVVAIPLSIARSKLIEVQSLLDMPTAQPQPTTIPADARIAEPARAPLAELSIVQAIPASDPKIVPMSARPPQPTRHKSIHQRLAEASAAGTM